MLSVSRRATRSPQQGRSPHQAMHNLNPPMLSRSLHTDSLHNHPTTTLMKSEPYMWQAFPSMCKKGIWKASCSPFMDMRWYLLSLAWDSRWCLHRLCLPENDLPNAAVVQACTLKWNNGFVSTSMLVEWYLWVALIIFWEKIIFDSLILKFKLIFAGPRLCAVSK